MFPDYEVVVVTGDKLNAGTKANVFMTLFGKTGVTPKIRLHNNTKSVFDRGSSDVFLIHTNCVGPMTKLRIEHDGTGLASGWYVERVSRYLWKEGNVLFNDTLNALNTFYLRLYGIRHMVKDHSDSEKGNPLPPHRLLFPINSKGSFICTIPQTR